MTCQCAMLASLDVLNSTNNMSTKEEEKNDKR